MPVDQGGIGGGGGTNICNVSPSDQIGTLDNILNRLQALESVMATLLGTNVEAAQLSDISNSLGWVYNVSFLGTEGWTQTPAGTLIPPPGWTGLSNLITPGQTTLYSGGSTVGDFNVLTKYVTSAINIGAGGSGNFHPNTDTSAEVNTGDTGLYEGTKGGSNAWISDTTASFLVMLYAEIAKGSSAPSSGFPRFRMVKYGSGATEYANASCPFPTAFPTYMAATAATVISVSENEGFKFTYFNRTNGDTVMSRLVVSFLKVG